MTIDLMNLWSIFLKGGPVMWPLLLISIGAMTIIVEKWIILFRLHGIWKAKRDVFFTFVEEDKLTEAADFCDSLPPLMGRTLKSGVLKYGSSREMILLVMDQAIAVEANELKKRMSLLACMVNVAPLLGLLATVIGLTIVFHAVHMRSNALNPLSLGDMSSGIWQALVATSAGLSIGTIAFVGHALLAQQINDLLSSIQESMQALANLLQYRWEGRDHAH